MQNQDEIIARVCKMFNKWQKKAWRHLKDPYSDEEKRRIALLAFDVLELKKNYTQAANEYRETFPWRSIMAVRLRIRKIVLEWLK